MMPTAAVRPMRDDEARTFLEIHHASVRGLASAFYPPDVIDQWSAPVTEERIARLLMNVDHAIHLIAEIDGRAVGLGSVVVSNSELRSCYVHPDAARKGVGSALVREIERIALNGGVATLHLHSSINAEPFYLALGYRSVERTEYGFRGSGLRMQAVKMEKELMPLELRLPRLDEEQEFLRAYRATVPDAPRFLPGYEEGVPLERYLQLLSQVEAGESPIPYHVPATVLLAFVGERIVGRVSIRHELNDFMRFRGGHIGYVVVPEYRRRGYATEMLRLALQLSREQLHLPRVLVTCDDDNIGSVKAIERNGGVLEEVSQTPGWEKPLRKYWIETARG